MPARLGITFFSGKKETHERKLPGERRRAGHSDGPALRSAWRVLATWAAVGIVRTAARPLVHQKLHALLDLAGHSRVTASLDSSMFDCVALFGLRDFGIEV